MGGLDCLKGLEVADAHLEKIEIGGRSVRIVDDVQTREMPRVHESEGLVDRRGSLDGGWRQHDVGYTSRPDLMPEPSRLVEIGESGQEGLG